jgi:hypothetical protein
MRIVNFMMSIPWSVMTPVTKNFTLRLSDDPQLKKRILLNER